MGSSWVKYVVREAFPLGQSLGMMLHVTRSDVYIILQD